MYKLWARLGIFCLLVGLVVYLDQWLGGSPWHWGEIWNHEAAVGIAISVGLALLFVADMERRRYQENLRAKRQKAKADK